MEINEQDSITKYLPSRGWLADYMKFTDGLEACPRFRLFSASVVLGAAINNKVWIQRGDEGLLPKLFPNLWAVLIAPPGRGHKTSCINMAVNCLIQACEDVRILSDKLTPEYLVKSLSAPASPKDIIRIGPRDATGLIKAPELSVFFGKQHYNIGLVSLITDLYDYREEWKSGTIARGGEVLKNVCISILGGTTPAWLHQMIPEDAFTGGFMSRFVMVEQPIKYFKKVVDPKKPPDLGWKQLVKELGSLGQVRGEIEWGPGSKEAYEEVYTANIPTGDAQKDAYRERESEHVLKIAMQLAICEGTLTLKGEHIQQAWNILKALREEVDIRIERLTTHPRMQLTQEIQDLLKMYGELSEEDLLKKVYRSLSLGEVQFYEALSVLKKSGIIEPIGKPGFYRYRLRRNV